MRRYFVFQLCIILFLSFMSLKVYSQDELPYEENIVRIKITNRAYNSFRALPNKMSIAPGQKMNTGIRSIDKLGEKHRYKALKKTFVPQRPSLQERHMKKGLHLWYEITLEDTLNDEILKEFQNDPNIVIAEPIYKKVQIGGKEINPHAIFNDTRFNEQWHYENTGQTGGKIDADIDLETAWDIQTGDTSVIVAVIDGGIDYTHIELNQAMWRNWIEYFGSTGVDDDGNGYIDDIYGYNFADGSGYIAADDHGTHVGGTIGAVNNNATGVSGIAGGNGSGNGVRLMSCQTFGSFTNGGFAEAFVYAADNGAIIAQNSWGYTSPGYYEQAILDAIDYFIDNAGKDDMGNQTGPMDGGIVIFAAGNNNSNGQYYPAFYSPVVAVASTNHNDQKASYSNYGSWVDIAAPGGEGGAQGVLSTLPGNNYGFMMGTSMACPHVSGVAALIVSEFGGTGFTNDQLKSRLVNNTDNIDSFNPSYVGLLGHGRLNAVKALETPDSIAPSPISDLSVIDTSVVSVTLGWTATGASADSGRASVYDLRYSTSPIDSANFLYATRVKDIILPDSSGYYETFEVYGLMPNTLYYFALKAQDNYGYTSSISNVVSVNTKDAPQISVSPGAFYQQMDSGQLATQILTISNTGNSDLEIEIPSNFVHSAGISTNNIFFTDEKISQILSKYKAITDYSISGNKVNLQITENINSDGSPEIVEGNVVASLKNDLSGVNVLSHNGISAFMINLEILGANTHVISSFVDTTMLDTIDVLIIDDYFIPSNLTSAVRNWIYRGGNLIIDADQDLTVFNNLTSGTGLEYISLTCTSGNTTDITFHEITDSIDEYYISTSSLASLNITGDALGLINDITGNVFAGLSSYGQGNILAIGNESLNYSGLNQQEFGINAVRWFAEDDRWLSVDIGSAVIPSGSSTDVTLTFNSDSLYPGTYSTNLTINSNDPYNQELNIPCTLHVNGVPEIQLNTDTLYFTTSYVGFRDSMYIEISNTGTDSLNVTDISTSNSIFTIAPENSSFSLDKGKTKNIAVYYEPLIHGSDTAILSVSSDDTSNSIIQVVLIGENNLPPLIQVTPDSIDDVLVTGDSSVHILQISNVGVAGSDSLRFELGIESITTSKLRTRNKKVYPTTYSIPENAEYVEGQVIVKFRNEVDQNEIISLKAELKATTIKTFKLIKAELWSIKGTNVQQAVKQFYGDDRLLYIEPNYILTIVKTPNDPLYSSLYGMHNTGQTGGTADADIDAPEAWDKETGKSVIIGVIDTGVDYLHEDLDDNIWTNPGEIPDNGVDDDGNGYIDDIHGWDFVNNDNDPMDDHYHGTHCSGTIAGEGNNGVGVAGVCWNARIMALKFLNSGGSGTTDAAIQAVEYATMNGADLTSNSWGGGAFSSALYDAIQASGDHNMLFVAAAGNSGTNNDLNPHYPSSYDCENIIAVAATDHNDQLANFSCYGATSVDIAAPGVDILSSVPGNNYDNLSGTSMATPHVSGAVALIWSRASSMSNLEVKQALMQYSDKISAVNGLVLSDGRLNINNVLENVSTWVSTDISTGTIGQGTSQNVNINFKAEGLYEGDYYSNIVIYNNDPGNNTIIVPAHLFVDGIPILSISDDSLEINSYYGYEITDSVLIQNVGTENLVFNEIVADTGLLRIDNSGLTIEPQSEGYLKITSLSDSVGLYMDTIQLYCNDTSLVYHEIKVFINCVVPPELSFEPDSVDVSVLSGDSLTQTLTINNTGNSELLVNVETKYKSSVSTAGNTIHIKRQINKESVFRKELNTNMSELFVMPLQAFYHNDFESGEQGWITENYNIDDLWHITDVNYNSETHSWYCGIDSLLNYETGNQINTAVITTPIDLTLISSDSLFLNFAESYNTEPNWDFCMVDVRLSGSSSWTPLRGTASAGTAPNGNSNGWIISSLDISNYIGQIVEFRFYFDTRDPIANGYPGWFFDDFTISNLSFEVSNDWLELHPTYLKITGGNTELINVTFYSEGLNAGDYYANILFNSNDPAKPQDTVPVYMHVEGAPNITLSKDSIVLTGYIGASLSDTIFIGNNGTDSLYVSNVIPDTNVIILDTTSFVIYPGGQVPVKLGYTPENTDILNGSILVYSNDSSNGVYELSYYAQGFEPPAILVSPAEYDVNVYFGDTLVDDLTIKNTGGSDLEYNINIEYLDSSAIKTVNNRIQNIDKLISKYDGITSYRFEGNDIEYTYNIVQDNDGQEEILSGSRKAALADDLSGLVVAGNVSTTFLFELELLGAETHYISSLYDTLMLDTLDVLIVRDGTVSITFAGAVNRWIRNGGNLLIDADQDITIFNTMIQGSGITYNSISLTYGYTSNIFNHDVTDTMSIFYINSSALAALDIVSPASELINDISNNTFAAASQLNNGKIVALGNETVGSPTYLNNMELGINAVRWFGGNGNWCKPSTINGTISAGLSEDIEITFDSRGLEAGDYFASISIQSNDPVESEVYIPVDFTIIGAPNMIVTKDSIRMSGYIGYLQTDTIIISNEGTDSLIVTDIISDTMAIQVDTTSFVILPGEQLSTIYTYLPETTDLLTGTISIFSNDSSNIEYVITYMAEGIVPPVIEVTPDSIHADLFYGDSITKILTINNTGGSDLDWVLEVSGSSASDSGLNINYFENKIYAEQNDNNNEGLGVVAPLSLDDIGKFAGTVNILAWVTYADMDWEYLNTISAISQYFTDFNITTTTTTDPAILESELNGNDIFLIPEQEGGSSSTFISYGLAWADILNDYVNGGGSVIMCGQFNGAEAILNESGLMLVNYEGNVGSGIMYVVEPEHKIVEGIPSSLSMMNATRYLTLLDSETDAIVENASGYATVAAKESGNGKVIYIGYDYYAYDDNAALIISNAVQWAASGSGWISTNLISGTISAGSSQDVQVKLNATGMDAGEYYANILFNCNDPANPIINIPVDLSIIGAPNLVLSKDSIELTGYIGTSIKDTIIISNTGNDSLYVFDIVTDTSVITVDTTSFIISPEAALPVIFSYTPVNTDLLNGKILIYSNDSSNLEYKLNYAARGIEPPLISVTPDSFDISLYYGDTLAEYLTISNTGGSDLEYNIEIEYLDSSTIKIVNNRIQNIDKLMSEYEDISSYELKGNEIEYTYNIVQINDGDEIEFSGNHRATLTDDLAGLVVAGSVSSTFLLELEMLGAETHYISSLVDTMMLDTLDVLIVRDGTVSTTYADAVNRWIRNGGNLLIDADQDISIFNNMIQGSGITYNAIYSTSGYTSTIFEHNVTDTMTVYYISSSAMATLKLMSPAKELINDIDNNTYAAASQINKGRVVALGNESIDSYSYLNNMELGINAVKWFKKGGDWLKPVSISGIVPAGSTQDIDIVFDARDHDPGNYFANIIINNNDPYYEIVTVPSDLTIIGSPNMEVSSDSLYFECFIGDSVDNELIIENKGNDVLSVYNININSGLFSVNSSSFVVNPGDTAIVEIVFQPESNVDTMAYLLIETNDSSYLIDSVLLYGVGQYPPVITVNPDLIDITLVAGDSSLQTIEIGNIAGGKDLTWNMSIDFLRDSLLTLSSYSATNNNGIMVQNKGGIFPMAVGDLTILASSPVYLTCLATDPNTGIIYAQQNGGNNFYSYDPTINVWSSLTSSPQYSGNNGGAVYLDGNVYCSYTGYSNIAIYNIDSDTWTTIPSVASTGNITTDGEYIYLAYSIYLYRFDPGLGNWITLSSSSPVSFQDWGGLSYHKGFIYGHTGNSSSGFAKYEIETNTWTLLNNVPSGAVLGSAIDPVDQKYFAYGSYGGNNLYIFDLITETWSLTGIPFTLGDGGLVHVGKNGYSGIYLIQGESGYGFAKYETNPSIANWLICSPMEGIVSSGSLQNVNAWIYTKGMSNGYYKANIAINNNDPVNSLINIPVNLEIATCMPSDTTFEQSVCEGDFVMVGDSVLTQEGSYSIVLTNIFGCDSTVNITLYTNPVDQIDIVETICYGGNVQIGDSIFTEKGIYQVILTNIYGCDSVVNLELTVNPTDEVFISDTICEGESIQIGKLIFSETGSYSVVLKNMYDCDSIVHLDLFVNPVSLVNISQTICRGKSVTIGDKIFTESGEYTVILPTIFGCDSIINLDLTITDPDSTFITQVICGGEKVMIGEETFTETGNYTVILPTSEGCDSVVNLDLTVNPSNEIFISDTICEGESIQIGKLLFTETGNYSVVLKNQFDCDSIVHLDLFVNPVSVVNISQSICQGKSVTIGDEEFTESGDYSITLTNIFGCDSVINLALTVTPAIETDIVQVICEGDSLELGDSVFKTSGLHTVVFTSADGCDSLVHLDLTVNNLPEVDLGKDTTINSPLILDAGSGFNTYKWNTGDGSQTIQVDSTFGYDSHTIDVWVTDNMGCENGDTIMITIEKKVGISEISIFETIKLYPNPTQDIINIDFSEVSTNVTIDVLTMDGMLVQTKLFDPVSGNDKLKMDLSGFTNGVYIIKLTSGNKVITKQVLLNK